MFHMREIVLTRKLQLSTCAKGESFKTAPGKDFRPVLLTVLYLLYPSCLWESNV